MTIQLWPQLLTPQRLGDHTVPTNSTLRTDFQRDFDRIIFCSAFRRMQDKTQVFPLSKIDYIRTRLTHSLEASSIGRSLGTLVGQAVIERHKLTDIAAADIGNICAAACLAHDIGNPPFGHSGEEAIRHWAKTAPYGKTYVENLADNQRNDFLDFEGNAQGFRIVSQLQNPDNVGGLQLTCATLAAFSKYPRTSRPTGPRLSGISSKKQGINQADLTAFQQVAKAVGLIPHAGHTTAWHRHPLAYLVEAADDIAYRVIDVEDGYRLGHLGYEQATTALLALLTNATTHKIRLRSIREPKDHIEYLRAKVINEMTQHMVACFMDNEPAILAGQCEKPLLEQLHCHAQLDELLTLAREHIYCVPEVISIQAAGYQVIGDLLERFIQVINEVAEQGTQASSHSKMLIQLIPQQFIGPDRQPTDNPYLRLLLLTDFISGMTDSYAVALYKQVNGISLPSK